MKSVILSSGLIIVLCSSIVGLSLYYTVTNSNNASQDTIDIDSVNVYNPDYRCFTVPCYFRVIKLNFTVHNSFDIKINSNNTKYYSLNIVSNSKEYQDLFRINDYANQKITTSENTIIPAGSWNDNYSAILSLTRMPLANEHFPTSISVQLSFANEILTSSSFSIDLQQIP